MAEKREVKVTLDIEQGKSVGSAFKQIGDGVRQLNQQAGQQGQSAGQSFAATFFKSMIAGVTGAAAINASAAIARVGHDSFLTAGQAGRQLFRDIVPFGGRIQGLTDSFGGRAAGMETAKYRSDQQAAAFEARNRESSMLLSLNPQLAEARNRSSVLASSTPLLMGGIDRSTGMGERNFREASRLLPVQREIAKAEREAQAAAAGRLQSEQELNKAVNNGNKLTSERTQLQKTLDANRGSGVDRQKIINRLGVVNDALDQNRELQIQARQQVMAQKTTEAQARANVGMQRAALKEAQASNLEDRAERSASGASALGMMNPFDRQRGVEAVRMLQASNGDLSQLPPDMQQLALQLSGQTGQRMVEGFGSRTPEFQRLQGLLPAEFSGNPEQLRRDASTARDQAERERMKTQQELSSTIMNAGQNMADMVSKAMLELVASMETRLLNNIRNTKNAP